MDDIHYDMSMLLVTNITVKITILFIIIVSQK